MRSEAVKMSSLDDELHISNLSYFSDTPPQELKELDAIRTVLHFRDGQRAPLRLHGHDGFYYLHRGFVKVICSRGGETVTRIAGPKDLVGFARWIDRSNLYNAVALSNVTMSFFRDADFRKLQDKSTYLSREVIRWLAHVLVTQERRLFALKSSSAKERVSHTLLILVDQFGNSIGGNDSALAVPIDRKTLAELSGVVPEVLSRVLKELEDAGAILRSGRVVTVTNKKLLTRV